MNFPYGSNTLFLIQPTQKPGGECSQHLFTGKQNTFKNTSFKTKFDGSKLNETYA